MARTKTYNTTWARCRDGVARALAEHEGMSYAQSLRELPAAVVTKEWMSQIFNALGKGHRLSPSVMRGLAKLFERADIVEMIGGSFPGYDWSYAEPTLARIKAGKAAAQ